jgi:two-component system nitrate/nitrite response regulator NarL
VLSECGDGLEAIRKIRALRPTVALVDLAMPGVDGLGVVEALSADETLPTRVVLLSAASDGEIVYRTLAAGAAGYLSKESDRASICDALIEAAEGGTTLGPEVQAGIASEIRRRRENDRLALTSRELEIVTMLAEGLSAPAMAERLFLSTATVKSHLQSLYDKLDVSDRAAAVAEAMRHGILE